MQCTSEACNRIVQYIMSRCHLTRHASTRPQSEQIDQKVTNLATALSNTFFNNSFLNTAVHNVSVILDPKDVDCPILSVRRPTMLLQPLPITFYIPFYIPSLAAFGWPPTKTHKECHHSLEPCVKGRNWRYCHFTFHGVLPPARVINVSPISDSPTDEWK
jgi:hypothetical protein